MRQPAIYLPHGGGPCFFMDWTMGPADTWERSARWLRELPDSLPERPRAILVVSAHWEEARPSVTVGAESLLYDYYGFPAHTYALEWAAPPAHDLAAQLGSLVGAVPVERGFDHGVFVPLKVAWDEPDIPVAQLSLVRGLDPRVHLAMGRELASLRDDGVLVIGSGMSFHNMSAFNRPPPGDGEVLGWSRSFNSWLERTCAEGPEGLVGWSKGDDARLAHPREEHLLPLMVCAAGPGRVDFRDVVMGAEVIALRFD